jgi:AraC-like DNA-binding protein
LEDSFFNYWNERHNFFISQRNFSNNKIQHTHNLYEIHYVFSGERAFFINDRTIKLCAGDVILISPTTLHKAINTNSTGCDGILLFFSETFLAATCPMKQFLAPLFDQEQLVINLPPNERNYFEQLFFKMLREVRLQNDGFELAVQALLLQTLVYLCRHIGQNQIKPFDNPSPIHEKVTEIVRFINRHYSEALSLTFLADHFYISPSYLSKVFKDSTGFTFIEYLNNVRIKEAKKLLIKSELKVIEIAEEVGFGSITHFGRVFKEITGCQPLAYRKQSWD